MQLEVLGNRVGSPGEPPRHLGTLGVPGGRTGRGWPGYGPGRGSIWRVWRWLSGDCCFHSTAALPTGWLGSVPVSPWGQPWSWPGFTARLYTNHPSPVRNVWGLGVAHYAEAVVVGVEAHDAVVANPELLPAPGKVDVLGREAQHAGIGMDRFLPDDGPAPGGPGQVVEARATLMLTPWEEPRRSCRVTVSRQSTPSIARGPAPFGSSAGPRAFPPPKPSVGGLVGGSVGGHPGCPSSWVRHLPVLSTDVLRGPPFRQQLWFT